MESTVAWNEVEALFSRGRSFAVATVDADGAPRVSPIGSVFLTGEGRGFYFEKFTRAMRANLDRDPRLCIMAVDGSKWFWLGALKRGRFNRYPALRLMCSAGPRRAAAPEEQQGWLDKVKGLRFFKGHDLLWKDMNHVREFTVQRVEPVELGRMNPQG